MPQLSYLQLAQEIRQLVANNELQTAFPRLHQELEGTRLYNQVILLKSDYELWQDRVAGRLRKEEDLDIEYQNIKFKVLEIIDQHEKSVNLEDQDSNVVSSTKAEQLGSLSEVSSFQSSHLHPLEEPNGWTSLGSPFYIKRKGEEEFLEHITHSKACARVRGPLQFGKTSLVMRVAERGRKEGYKVAIVDFKGLQKNTLKSLELLIYEFCENVARQLGLVDQFKNCWEDIMRQNPDKDRMQAAEIFIEEVILIGKNPHFLLCLDDADRAFSYKETSDDFFSMLRSWHDKSAVKWKHFKLLVSYSTEVRGAITDINKSPFNIGKELRLSPFVKEEIRTLSKLHGLDLQDLEIDQLIELSGGHPYLVRKTLFELRERGCRLSNLLKIATANTSPFAPHLKDLLSKIHESPELVIALKDIINTGRCERPIYVGKLEEAGLVFSDQDGSFKVSCGLYEDYFKLRI